MYRTGDESLLVDVLSFAHHVDGNKSNKATEQSQVDRIE
jgi:hypothetical protein